MKKPTKTQQLPTPVVLSVDATRQIKGGATRTKFDPKPLSFEIHELDW